MSKKDAKVVNAKLLPITVGNALFDGWVLMLALGGLSHINGWPQIALSYWSCVLIVVVSITLIPQSLRATNYLEKMLEKL